MNVNSTNFTLKKSQKLLSSASFHDVFNQSKKKYHQSHLMAFVLDNKLGHARLGMAITKKKVPTAVKRNQLKRLIREQFRHQSVNLPSCDIVFIVKRSVGDLSKVELTVQIGQIFKKLGQ